MQWVSFVCCFCFLRKIETSNRRNVASNIHPTAPPSDHSLDKHEQRRRESKTTSLLRSGAPSDIIWSAGFVIKILLLHWLTVGVAYAARAVLG